MILNLEGILFNKENIISLKIHVFKDKILGCKMSSFNKKYLNFLIT